MPRMLGVGRTVALVAACVALALAWPRAVSGQDTVRQQGAAREAPARATVGWLAEQLGIAAQSGKAEDDFDPGVCVTGVLKDPAKLARFGIRGMSAGARVTAMRVSPVKVHLEVDQVEPVTARESVSLRIDERGRLSIPKP